MSGMYMAIATVAAAGVSAYAGNRAAKKANQRTDTEKMMEALMYSGAVDKQEFQKLLMELAKDPIISSRNFTQAAANGDQNTVMQLLGDDLSNISEGARQSFQTMAQLMPRSGASASFLNNLPYQTANEQTRLMTNTKMNAKRGQFGEGTALASLGGNFGNDASRGAESYLNYGANRRAYADRRGDETAEATYNTLMGIVNAFGGAYGKKGGGGSGGSSPYGGKTGSAGDFWSGGGVDY